MHAFLLLFANLFLAVAHTAFAQETPWRTFTFTVERITANQTLDRSEDDLVLGIGMTWGTRNSSTNDTWDLGPIEEGQTLPGNKRGIAHVVQLPKDDRKNLTIAWGLSNVPDPTEEKVQQVMNDTVNVVVGLAQFACRNPVCAVVNAFENIVDKVLSTIGDFFSNLINPSCKGPIAYGTLRFTKATLQAFAKDEKKCTIVNATNNASFFCGDSQYHFRFCLQRGEHGLERKDKDDTESQPMDTSAEFEDTEAELKTDDNNEETGPEDDSDPDPDDVPGEEPKNEGAASVVVARWGLVVALPFFYLLL